MTHFVLKSEQAHAQAEFEPAARLTVELLPIAPDGKALVLNEEIRDRAAEVIRKRLAPEGSKSISIEREGTNRLVIGLAQETDLAKARAMIEKSGQLEFREKREEPSLQSGEWITRMGGDKLEQATASPDEYAGRWAVNFELTKEGTKEFATLTEELLGKQLGIFFDGEEISAPTINTPITGGRGVITGSFTEEEAKALANYLTAGKLPVKVRLVPRPARETDSQK